MDDPVTPLPLQKFAAAMCKAQGQIENAQKDATNPHFKSDYATLASVRNAIRKPFADNGLCYIQIPTPTDNGGVTLRTVILHTSGEYMDCYYPVTPGPTTPQQLGLAMTYARRFSLSAMSGIAPEDDDGNAVADTVTAVAKKAPPKKATPPEPAPPPKPEEKSITERVAEYVRALELCENQDELSRVILRGADLRNELGRSPHGKPMLTSINEIIQEQSASLFRGAPEYDR